MDCRCVIMFSEVLDAPPFSNTTNSSVTGAGWFIDPNNLFPGALTGVGDGSFPVTDKEIIRLVRLLAIVQQLRV